MAISLLLPVRKGSERIEYKNTRKFSDFENGLLEYKLEQLRNIKNIDEVIVSSNDEKCIDIAGNFKNSINNLKIIKRPERLGNSKTNLTDLIKYFAEISDCSDFLWTHVTSPFCQAPEYDNAIEKYRSSEVSDSLMSGYEFKEFLYDQSNASIINNLSQNRWPRTQDLENYFLINNAIFITSRENYKKGDRIGQTPYLYTMDKISSLDIDVMLDFEIAEAVYEKYYK